MKRETGLRVKQYIRESGDIAKKCSHWRFHIDEHDDKRNEDQALNTHGITEPETLLKWFQNQVFQTCTKSHNSNPPNKLKIPGEEKSEKLQVGCCSWMSKCCPGRKSAEKKSNVSDDTKQDVSHSFILGYSEDVDLEFESHGQRFEIKSIKLSDECNMKGEGGYQGFYSWPRTAENFQDLYMGEFRDGRFHGYGAVFYGDGGFYKGQWRKDMQEGFGVQRWKNGHVYIGQWEGNREHGHGAYYCPPIEQAGHHESGESGDSLSKTPKYSLFIGDFANGYPTHGVLLEGENFSDLTAEDLVPRWKSVKTSPAVCSESSERVGSGGAKQNRSSRGARRVFQIMYDGRSAFWQRAVPLEQYGEFEARVRVCDYESRELVKTLFKIEKIEDVWYKVVCNSPKGLDILNANNLKMGSEEATEDSPAPQKRKHAPLTHGHTRLEKLYKTISFHGTCIRNKAGYFPCPLSGRLFDDGQEFEVEYDGRSLLTENVAPINLRGELKCSIPVSVRNPRAKDPEPKSVIQHRMEGLASVYVLESPDSPHEFHFKGTFELKSFASVGIILMGNKIYKVDFDEVINLNRVMRKTVIPAETSVSKKDLKNEKKKNVDSKNKGGKRDSSVAHKKHVVEDDDRSIEEMQIIDFDKLIGTLKGEKKLIEIPVPRKSHGTKEFEVVEVLQPRDAMKEALKVLSAQLWSQNGTLRQRLKHHPGEEWHVGTHEFEATQGALFHGWFRKVYCPKGGSSIVYPIGNHPSQENNRCPDDFEQAVGNIRLEDCLLYPKTKVANTRNKKVKIESLMPLYQEWIAFFLYKLKSAYVSNMKNTLEKQIAEIMKIEAEIEIQKKSIEEWKSNLERVSLSNDTSTETTDLNVMTFLHTILPKSAAVKREVSEENDLKFIKRMLKTSRNRMDELQESLVRKGLAAARTQELVTDIFISEARYAMRAAQRKCEQAFLDLQEAMGEFDDDQTLCNEDIKTHITQLEEIKVAHAQLTEQASKVLDNDSPIKKEVEAKAKAKADAKLALEIARRRPETAANCTALAGLILCLLDLTQPVTKLRAEVEKEIHQKSNARRFSERALLKKQQWVHLSFSGCDAAEKHHMGKQICLMDDQQYEMHCHYINSDDEVVSTLILWSRRIASLVEEEENFNHTWVKCATEESSVNPTSQVLQAAEKKLESLVSETRDELKRFHGVAKTNEESDDVETGTGVAKTYHPSEIKELKSLKSKLMHGCKPKPVDECKASRVSFALHEFASFALEVAQNRLSQASDLDKQFPVIDSRDFLKKLDDAIKSLHSHDGK